MSIIGSNILAGASGQATGGYAISRSLRFNSSDSAYLSRTPASTGNRKTWTWAGWVKRSSIGTDNYFFGCNAVSNATQSFYFAFGAGGTDAGALSVLSFGNFYRKSTALFRDPSAWYHIVVTLDTTQATATNRIRIYVNGNQLTSFSISSDPAQNADLGINQSSQHVLGNYAVSGGTYFPGYLADIHFIDGQALDPTSFGEFDATTGVWNPKAYTGSYGTNGFRLDFSDNSAATATTLGKDRAGSNNWTPNNLSVTAGSGNDSLVDVPTNGAQTDTGVGGEVRGNYCTLNPLNNGGVTLVNGNLDWTRSAGGSTAVAYSTIAVSSSKWYFETTMNGAGSGVNWECGVATTTTANNIRPGTTATGWGLVTSSNTIIYKQNSNSLTSIFSGTLSTGDVIGVAFDLDNGRIWFARNNTWLEGSPSAGTGASYTNLSGTVSAFFGGDGSAVNGAANFGQRPFAYTAPSGFKALNTANLPAPLVTKPSTVMDVALWTGNGSARSITGLAFNPDLVWIKGRSGATDHALYDAVRGVQIDLVSNSTAAETTQTQGLTAFNSDGFSLGTLAKVNTSSATYAGWVWDAGSSTVTNTVGSITSQVQVRANASAGFSVVTYTGTGANATVGHGLGATPGLIIVKTRNTTRDWLIWTTGFSSNEYLLFTTAAKASAAGQWGSLPTSTVFGVFDGTVNASGNTFVAYCFAPVAGYSSMGSYVAGTEPFVYLGFRPAFLLVKSSTSAENWNIFDNRRSASGSNVIGYSLQPNLSNAEYQSEPGIDFLSNGFKLKGSVNTAGQTYIYFAVAESPFQYARAR